jgi:hypothetical protein
VLVRQMPSSRSRIRSASLPIVCNSGHSAKHFVNNSLMLGASFGDARYDSTANPRRLGSIALSRRGDLRRVLSDLRIGHAFDMTAVHEIYLQLGEIIGRWMSEQQRLEVSPVGKALLSTAKSLNEVSALLGGLKPGIHSDLEIAVASRTVEYLAMDPTVGSLDKARELVSAFQRDDARVAHVCMVARADLPDGPGERGRRALNWYDDFTALCWTSPTRLMLSRP